MGTQLRARNGAREERADGDGLASAMIRREAQRARERIRSLESELEEARVEAERLEERSGEAAPDGHAQRLRRAQRRVARIERKLARAQRYRPGQIAPLERRPHRGGRPPGMILRVGALIVAVALGALMILEVVADNLVLRTGDVPPVLMMLGAPLLIVVCGYIGRNAWRDARSQPRAYDRFQLRLVGAFMALIAVLFAAAAVIAALQLLDG